MTKKEVPDTCQRERKQNKNETHYTNKNKCGGEKKGKE
jgi:hypothetical protein